MNCFNWMGKKLCSNRNIGSLMMTERILQLTILEANYVFEAPQSLEATLKTPKQTPSPSTLKASSKLATSRTATQNQRSGT